VAVVVQPASGDVLQFLKAGIMEVPDVLVLTKADLANPARRAIADLTAALTTLGAPDTKLCPVSSVAPPTGISELIDALETHRKSLDLPARRLRARRRHALDEFAAEHGERGLRALGGRVAAERWLTEQAPTLDVGSLTRALENRALENRADEGERR
ncbi:MAG TPA: ArgK protein, partial [Solirubrobacteraceae bacterium]|nr:ArgK protein [Solirubrobacteraceae bacterium]